MKMPAKRRQKTKGKSKHVKKKGAPSEEMDSQSTQDSENQDASANEEMSIVLTRLSKRHLLNSSSEASDYSHKENIPARVGDPYDADLETTDAASTAGESDMEFSAGHIKGILSPSRYSNRRTRQNSKGMKKKVTIQVEAEKDEDSSTPKTDSALSLDMSLKRCFPKLYASDTSTPQSAGSESKSELNDSAFGFDGLAAHEDLPFSPVPAYTPDNQQSVSSSATSGISSRQSSRTVSSSLSTSDRLRQQKRTYTVNLSCLVGSDDDSKRKTKKKKTATRQEKKEQAEDWALKIGAEFNDIEMHELSVE